MPYSEKFREKMVQKMTGPRARSAGDLSQEVGVSQSTLSKWLRQAKEAPMSDKKDKGAGSGGSGRRRRWSPEDKVRLVMEAAALGDDELGAFLRREGLHEADLERFREEVQQAATEGLQAQKGRRRGQLSPEDKRIRQLEKELRRKEKALAEAAALLVLRGKVQAFLASEEEEGDTDESNDK